MKIINQSQPPTLLFKAILILLLITMFGGLAYALFSLPEVASGLSVAVSQHIEISGVSNPVTAVLLNYRAYDTLLELAVLLLAMLAVWSLGPAAKNEETPPGEVLELLTRALVPLLILVAGYLLWAGASLPGGAFQAGALLAAAGVLLLLSGYQPSKKILGLPLRIAVVSGLVIFIVVGAVFVLMDKQFLEYPLSQAAGLILFIEAAATLSIGITLVALFVGGRPEVGKK